MTCVSGACSSKQWRSSQRCELPRRGVARLRRSCAIRMVCSSPCHWSDWLLLLEKPIPCVCRAMLTVWRGIGSAVRGFGAAMDALGASLQGNLAPRENLMPPINRLTFQGTSPSYGEYTFVAPNAAVIGNVAIGPRSSVWYGATLRGDVNAITIGHTTNIQDKAVVHVAKSNPNGDSLDTKIGNKVCSCCLCSCGL